MLQTCTSATNWNSSKVDSFNNQSLSLEKGNDDTSFKMSTIKILEAMSYNVTLNNGFWFSQEAMDLSKLAYFVFPIEVPGQLDPLSFHNLRVDMLMNKTKFERNSSLGYYHMACIGKTKHKLKRSISHMYNVALCTACLDISTNNLMCVAWCTLSQL